MRTARCDRCGRFCSRTHDEWTRNPTPSIERELCDSCYAEVNTKPRQVTTSDEVAALPVGQLAITADGDVICLFDTHIGFPQRMWGRKPNGGTRGRFSSFSHLGSIELPIDLADLDWGDGPRCQHPATNECGQCLNCGEPNVGEHREMYLDPEGMAAFRWAAEANSRLGEVRP